jgi:tetratricopeptide (TPR) repeat protein
LFNTRDSQLLIELGPRENVVDEEHCERIARTVMSRMDQATDPTVRYDLIAVLEELAAVHPGTWEYVAETRKRGGEDNDRVRDAYREGLRADPARANLWILWVELETESGKIDRALSLYSQATNACRHDKEALASLSRSFLHYVSLPEFRRSRHSKLEVAQALREALLDHEPDLDGDAVSRLAWLELHIGDTKKALRHVQAGLRRDHSNARLLDLLKRMQQSDPELFE